VSEVEKLREVKAKIITLRRRQAQQILGGGELVTYAAGIQRTQQWLAAVDQAIVEETETAATS